MSNIKMEAVKAINVSLLGVAWIIAGALFAIAAANIMRTGFTISPFLVLP